MPKASKPKEVDFEEGWKKLIDADKKGEDIIFTGSLTSDRLRTYLKDNGIETRGMTKKRQLFDKVKTLKGGGEAGRLMKECASEQDIFHANGGLNLHLTDGVGFRNLSDNPGKRKEVKEEVCGKLKTYRKPSSKLMNQTTKKRVSKNEQDRIDFICTKDKNADFNHNGLNNSQINNIIGTKGLNRVAAVATLCPKEISKLEEVVEFLKSIVDKNKKK
jgi:hypothetical protein